MTEADPGRVIAHVATLVDLGRYQQAIRQLASILATDPHNSHALCLLARARLGVNDNKGAETAAAAAIAADPDNEWALRIASLALQRMDFTSDSVRMARRAVGIAPTIGETHARLAMALAADNSNLDEARHAADRAVELNPHAVDAYLAVGAVALADRRPRDAQQAIAHALAIDPTSAAAHNELARTHLHRRRFVGGAMLGRAAAGFGTALRSDPNEQVSRRNLDVVLHVFLGRLAYYVFIVAFIGSRIAAGTNVQHAALYLPTAALALPAFFVTRFLARLSPQLRQYLWRSFRAPLRGLAGAALAAACLLLPVGALVPHNASGMFLLPLVLSIAARIALYKERARAGLTKRQRSRRS